LLTIFATVCAVAFVAAWVAAPWYCCWLWIGLDRGTHGRSFDFRTTGSGLEIIWITFTSDPGRTGEGWLLSGNIHRWAANEEHPSEWVHRGGWGARSWFESVQNYGPPYTNRYDGVSIPLWLLAAACALVPVSHAYRRRIRRRRRIAGQCAACGYDLRATSDRCPECGAAVEGAASPAPA
jgi:hypothetical protein